MPTNSSGKRSSKHPRSRLYVLLFLSKGIYFLLPFFSLAPKSFALFLLPDSIRRRAEGKKSSSFFFLSSPSNKSIPQSSSSAGGEKERRRRRRMNKTTEKMGWKGEEKGENKRNAFSTLVGYIKEWKWEKRRLIGRVSSAVHVLSFSPLFCARISKRCQCHVVVGWCVWACFKKRHSFCSCCGMAMCHEFPEKNTSSEGHSKSKKNGVF